ncbi:cytochrome d ubiquinol oxidase subunit II [Streptomyces sp. NPDC054933]
MDIFWYALTGVLFAGYLALESLDFGVGMLFFLARTEEDREQLRRTVVPLFLANEVWLVAFVGLLFGALPLLEGELLHALRSPMVVLLCAWFLRDGGLWFRAAHPALGWRRTWDVVIPVTSLVLAAGWGAVLATLIRGLSTSSAGHPVATAQAPLHPFSLACAAVVVAGSLRQGTLFVARNLSVGSAFGARTERLTRQLTWLLLALILVTAVIGLTVCHAPVALTVYGVLPAIAVYGSGSAHCAGRTARALLLGTAPVVALPVAVGLANGTTVLATRSGQGELKLSSAIADSATLHLLSATVFPALIAVAFAQMWIWRVFPSRSDSSPD